MKRIFSLIIFLFAIACFPQVNAASRVLFDGFAPTSPGVGPSPSNEPAASDPFRYFQIYLPDGYDAPGNTKSYPVVYFLHGFGQDYTSYSGIFKRLDQEIKSGNLAPMIVVKPDGSLADGWLGSFFINSSLNGDFGDYITQELRTYVNSNYRTKIDKASTGICGHSMGGYASFLLSILNPDIYSTVTAHTPSTIIAMAPQISNPDFYQGVLEEIPTSGPSAGKVLPTNGQKSYMLYALSAALSPDLSNPPFLLDLPIVLNPDYTPVLSGGQLVPNAPVIAQWLQNDPYSLVANSSTVRDNLKSERLLIDFGSNEPLISTTGATLFEQLLASKKIKFQHAVYKGSNFAQAELYTPSNDINESLVQPALAETASLLAPPDLQAQILVDFVIQAINADPTEFDATTFANFGGFLSVVCGITNPPATTGELLVDPAFLSCLAANGIDPDQFISDYFSIPGYVSIDPILFSIDTDGFLPCGNPRKLFISFGKCK